MWRATVHGLLLDGVRTVTYRDDLPDARLVAATDVVVRVHRAGLCGSDLHPYEGREVVRYGVVPGHEAVGQVVAVGAAVTSVGVGDRVLVPFTTSCGHCDACHGGLSSRCVRGALFGYGDPASDTPALAGAQAELLRVPLADTTVVPVPLHMSDLDALLLTDNFPTSWYAAARGDIARQSVVAVVGLGSVGLCAVVAAVTMGAARVLAVDPVQDRRARAVQLGAEPLTPAEAAQLPGVADAVVEAAGTTSAQALAFDMAQPGGTLSVIAVQTGGAFAFTPVQAYDRNITLRAGRAPVRSLLSTLLPMVTSGGIHLPTDVILTHPDVALPDGPGAYERFACREAGVVKMAFVT
jgi:alcohol dehydrogenase